MVLRPRGRGRVGRRRHLAETPPLHSQRGRFVLPLTRRPDCFSPPTAMMRLPTSPLSTAAAAAAGALLLKHELDGRKTAERVAAAALESLLKAIDANDAQTGAHVRRVASYALVL